MKRKTTGTTRKLTAPPDPRIKIVKASSETLALTKGAELLDLSPETVSVAPEKPGRYTVTPKNAPAKLVVEIAEDKMSAEVVAIFPALGSGAAEVSGESMQALLAEEGVKAGVEERGLVRLLQMARVARPLTKAILIAEGLLPRQGKPESVELTGGGEGVVLPGDLAGKRVAATSGFAGTCVDGTEIPQEKVSDSKIELGENVKFGTDNTSLISTTYGIPSFNLDVVHVEPVFQVSEDNLVVTATVYPKDAAGQEITAQRFIDGFLAMGIKNGVQVNEINELFAGLTGRQEGVVVARGSPPEPGEDGSIEYHIPAKLEPGRVNESGKVDYRDRGALHSVVAGDSLFTVHPPTPGTPGQDVYGNTIPNVPGEALSVSFGLKIKAEGDRGLHVAMENGIFFLRDNVAEIHDGYLVEGDVDYAVGNVVGDVDMVKVSGSLTSGFKIEVPGHVMIAGGVDDGSVSAGGNIEVEHGMVSKAGASRLHKGDNIRAKFIRNCKVIARRDVLVFNELVNSDVLAGGKVQLTEGKGVLIGGTTHGVLGVDAQQVGNERGTQTRVIVGPLPKELARYRIELEQVDTALEKFQKILTRFESAANGNPDQKVSLPVALVGKPEGAEPEKKPDNNDEANCPPATVTLTIKEAAEKIKSICAQFEDKKKQLAEQKSIWAKARFRVYGKCFPGVSVSIVGEVLKVRDSISRSVFYLDSQTNHVVHGPL